VLFRSTMIATLGERDPLFLLNPSVLMLLYVCTFGKGSSRKEHHVVSRRRIDTLETTEVSDASSHYMSG
jgi:hypothetical protein